MGESMSGIFARIVAIIGALMSFIRHGRGGTEEPVFGGTPEIPKAQAQGIPTLKMPTARGWNPGETPTAAAGLQVNAFAKDLDHPRWIYVMPSGDVLVSEAIQEGRPPRTAFDYAMQSTMRRARALGKSANRISLWRDSDGDGVAEVREVFMEGLNQPFGMALIDKTFYVGNTDGIVAFPYEKGATSITDV
ncbi:MAG: sorbosone dehydrogenase family protein, partial [Pseudomonadota bacterium]